MQAVFALLSFLMSCPHDNYSLSATCLLTFTDECLSEQDKCSVCVIRGMRTLCLCWQRSTVDVKSWLYQNKSIICKDSFLFALYAVGNEASQLCELTIWKVFKRIGSFLCHGHMAFSQEVYNPLTEKRFCLVSYEKCFVVTSELAVSDQLMPHAKYDDKILKYFFFLKGSVRGG